ncbi:carbamate kinase [Caproiciproducens galactitolivorans]|uniref:Carbamate kinase n=1 Tax=Caproiciproducens galactitolivorans TaxID=642589 RepID=A0ABT4BQ80_9FIRM|nr:carbamate kinase [Caproiciproducens galactitolivorans]MCY1712964.1 carbamate kinase [Caproiciproducens galactitolivorans]
MSRIVIALGGNALGNNAEEQQRKIDEAAPSLIGLIKQGHEIIVSHGNGPQVGMINLAFDAASQQSDKIAKMELPECTAMSQGYIGYHLQKGILKELKRVGMPWHVATVVTQVEVGEHDPAFSNPTKPIGAFYDEETVQSLKKEKPDAVFAEDAGRGWRRMVASPKPMEIVERDSILNLLDHEFIVIACGGGGIPVVKDAKGNYNGVPAVIDKDFASAKLAETVGAQYLFILTAVDKVAINFGKANQQNLDEMTVEQAEKYCEEGQFAKGSMLPKVQAAIQFVKSGENRRAVIASLEKAPMAMKGESGTLIHA